MKRQSPLLAFLLLFFAFYVSEAALCPDGINDLLELIDLAACGQEASEERVLRCLKPLVCAPDFKGKKYKECEKSPAEALGQGGLGACTLAIPALVCKTSFKDLNKMLCGDIVTSAPTSAPTLPHGKVRPPDTCETYSTTLDDGVSLGFCAGLVNYPYFLPGGKTQGDLEMTIAEQLLSNPSTASFYSMFPYACGATLKEAICKTVFQQCMLAEPYLAHPCNACEKNGTATACIDPTWTPELEAEHGPCILGIGHVPGESNMTWSQAMDGAISGAGLCASYGLTFKQGACAQAVGRLPCKGLCNQLHDSGFDTAICPLLSIPLGNETTEINFFSAFQALPDCDRLALEHTRPQAGIVRKKAKLGTGSGDSGACGAKACSTYVSFTDTSICPQYGGTPSVQQQWYSTALTSEDACADFINAPEVQASDEQNEILVQKLGYFANVSNARGGYFVPAWGGLPPLGQRFRPGSVPASADPYSLFLNRPGGLCSTGGTGYNSLECRNLQTVFGLSQVPAYVDPKCQVAFREFLCLQAKMKLEVQSLCFNPSGCGDPLDPPEKGKIGFTLALPRFPDRQICTNVNEKCSAFIGTLRETLQGTEELQLLERTLDCEAAVPSRAPECDTENKTSKYWGCGMPNAGIPSYPVDEQVLFDPAQDPVLGPVVSTFLSQIKAATGETIDVAIRTTTTKSVLVARGDDSDLAKSGRCRCPSPTIPIIEGEEGMQPGFCCNYPCMLPFFTESEYSQYKNWLIALNLLGVICGILFVSTYIIFQDKSHLKAVLYFAVASLVVSLAILVNGFANNEKLFCKSPTQVKNQGDGGYCLINSVIITFFGLSGTLWWWCCAHNIFLRVYLEKKNVRYIMKRYHFIAFGYPAFMTICTLATNNYGYAKPLLYCVFRIYDDPDTVGWRQKWDLYIFFTPVIIAMASGITMMLLVMKKIYKAANAIKMAGKRKIKRLWEMERTSIMFVFCFSIFWIFSLFFRFNENARRQEYADSIAAYTECILANFANGIMEPATDPSADNSILHQYGVKNGTGCGEIFPVRPNGFLVDMLQLTTFSQGILNFAIHAPGILKKWKKEAKSFASNTKRKSVMFTSSVVAKSMNRKSKQSGTSNSSRSLGGMSTGSRGSAVSRGSMASRKTGSSMGDVELPRIEEGTNIGRGFFHKSLKFSQDLFRGLMHRSVEQKARTSMSSSFSRSPRGSGDSHNLNEEIDGATDHVVAEKGLGFYKRASTKQSAAHTRHSSGLGGAKSCSSNLSSGSIEVVGPKADMDLAKPTSCRSSSAHSVQIDFSSSTNPESSELRKS